MQGNKVSRSFIGFYNQPQREFINLQEIIKQCKFQQISCQKLPQTQLEDSVGIVSLKAFKLNAKNYFIFVFISSLPKNLIEVTTYAKGQKIQQKSVKETKQIVQVIKNSLNKSANKGPSETQINRSNYLQSKAKIQNKFKEVLGKSNGIRSNNEIQATQLLKTTKEYQELIKIVNKVCEEIQVLCFQSQSMKEGIVKKNKDIFKLMLILQKEKQQLENAAITYDTSKNQIWNVRKQLDNFIEEKKKIISSLKNHYDDDQSFKTMLQTSIQLKIMQNQRKYLV